jgi:hypothetical protein
MVYKSKGDTVCSSASIDLMIFSDNIYSSIDISLQSLNLYFFLRFICFPLMPVIVQLFDRYLLTVSLDFFSFICLLFLSNTIEFLSRFIFEDNSSTGHFIFKINKQKL